MKTINKSNCEECLLKEIKKICSVPKPQIVCKVAHAVQLHKLYYLAKSES